ncbi:MAG: tetratricopeptide repeat protein [Paucibacter sp.]|nr:tetratricopeptide repeat protein [Roseateles sp.]
MDTLRLFLLGGLSALLVGCATAPPPLAPQAVLRDELFKPASEHIETEAEIFAASPAMQRWLREHYAQLHRDPDGDLRRSLVNALDSSQQLHLDYDATFTRDAAQSFDARSGNCLSLVIMTAAMAGQLDLPVQFQKVFVEDSWSRDNNLMFLAGHVNLTLSRGRDAFVRSVSLTGDELMVDFIPAADLRGAHVHEIDRQTVAAMFMNNRAAEALDVGRLDDAYWWVRAALLEDPRYVAAYNTLGVIYRRHGNLTVAEESLHRVTAVEPESVPALANLVVVLRDEGRTSEAQALDARVRQLQPYAPFHFFDLGIAAMKAREYAKARALFEREIAREAYYHEFHFWLALADYGLGDFDDARHELQLALDNSTTHKAHALYAAKLDWLNAHQPPDPTANIGATLRREALLRGQ